VNRSEPLLIGGSRPAERKWTVGPDTGFREGKMHQLSLFEAAPPSVEPTSGVRRIALDAGSWLEHHPGWMTETEDLFAELMHDAGWEQRTRWMFDRRVTEPRLTAEYPDAAEAPRSLQGIAERLSDCFGTRYDKLWVNLYRSHRDSTSWHGDHIGKIQPQSIVPVLSLGATRRFLIRPKDGGASVSLQPASGDLIVMGGRAQVDWRHSVPKQATPAGPRISINFAPRW
jgi:alkylated DNA repair dioxygenase AlkB